jgi:uncharacterized protein YbaA (DUF1428 family)
LSLAAQHAPPEKKPAGRCRIDTGPFVLWPDHKEMIMTYVDGFLLAVPKARLDEYKDLARKGCEVWMEHGALSYLESTGDDVPYGELTSFPRAVQAKDDEIVIFAWVTYESRAERDRILKLVMEDPRMNGDMDKMPFDGKRMIVGGFEAFVQA